MLVENVINHRGGADAAEELKNQGLRPIWVEFLLYYMPIQICADLLSFFQNAFWDIKNSDPFKALSWDHMHNYAHGLGGKHLWPLVEKYLQDLGRTNAHTVDKQ
jgi:hypothetical protein